MRLVHSVALSSLLLACGAAPMAATAEPRRAVASSPLFTEPVEDDVAYAAAIRAHYTKYEYDVPMRDGVRLRTHVYAPKDSAHLYPMLMKRTPYAATPYGVDNYPDERDGRTLRNFAPSRACARDGFIFVHQDVRGKMMSGGEFVDVRPAAKRAGEVDEATDAWDTVDWLVRNVPGHNGRVGVWGISYPGFYAAQAAVDAHPAVKAVSPQAPVTEWFVGDDFHHNGAFFLAAAFDFYSSFGKKRPTPTRKASWGFDYDSGDAYEFFLRMGPVKNAAAKHFAEEIPFWNDVMRHGARDDFWRARDPRPRYRNVRPAVMTVGGWFDAENLWGALETYRAFESQSPARAENVLVMGPWRHGGWARADGDVLGEISFGQKTSLFYREQIELPFFRRTLKGTSDPAPPEAWVFETGTNEWRRFDAWPPRATERASLYLAPAGALVSQPARPPADSGADDYVSDPAHPVPYRQKPSATIDEDYMTEDQRFASRRPDVLTYETAPLGGDVALAGPVEATLWVTTTGTDADFVVKLVDVYPADVADRDGSASSPRLAGYQQLVRAEVLRAKFRDGFDQAKAMVPGAPTRITVRLPDVLHTFRRGHKLMVQVQSSWFPLVDRNPQTFVDIYAADAGDFRKATHTVLRRGEHASKVDLPVLRGTLP